MADQQGTAGPFVRACAAGDLGDGEPVRVRLEGTPVCLVRTEGEVFAIADRCSHADVALSEGDVDGYLIECFLHGSAFDLRTGRPTSLPANRPVPVYPVRIEGDDVLVSLAPASPQPAQEN
jgi:3-phenylpropionate/trans-cinnamate dioxygenase ferredoxin component